MLLNLNVLSFVVSTHNAGVGGSSPPVATIESNTCVSYCHPPNCRAKIFVFSWDSQVAQPGFKKLPDDFTLGEYEMDKDHWVEDFDTKVIEPVWSVWRQDENGNRFLVKGGLTQSDALLLVREYEQKGHKQTYWAKITE